MIVNKYSNGGIGGGVTPEQVQEQINSALTPYWDSATTKSAIAEVATGISLVLEGYATSDDMQSAFTLISETQQAAEAGFNQLEARIDELSGSSPDLSAYYTSAQTESAIEEALSGYSPDLSAYYTSAQTEDAIQEALSGYSVDLSGYYTSAQTESAIQEAIAGVSVDLSGYYTSAQTESAIDEAMTAYTPTTGFSTINGSAITDGGNLVIESTSVDLSGYYTSAQTQDAIVEAMTAYTPTTGFATINGSAITTGGNIVIESTSVDLSGYYTSAQTESAIEEAIAGVSVDLSAYWTSAETQSAIKVVEDHLYDVEQVTASALTELHDGLVEVSGRTVDMSNYYTSSEVDNAIRTATADMVTSTYISSIWKGTQAEYDAIANKDPNTFYIIL